MSSEGVNATANSDVAHTVGGHVRTSTNTDTKLAHHPDGSLHVPVILAAPIYNLQRREGQHDPASYPPADVIALSTLLFASRLICASLASHTWMWMGRRISHRTCASTTSNSKERRPLDLDVDVDGGGSEYRTVFDQHIIMMHIISRSLGFRGGSVAVKILGSMMTNQQLPNNYKTPPSSTTTCPINNSIIIMNHGQRVHGILNTINDDMIRPRNKTV